jgi:hypothetical protein
MKRTVQLLMTFIAILTLFFQSPAWALQPGLPDMGKRYEPMLADLQGTGIPLRLPTYMPTQASIRSGDAKANAEMANKLFHIHLDEYTPNGYRLTVGYTPDCDGGNACRMGTIEANRLTKGTPAIDESFAFMKPNSGFKGERSQELMQPVDLAKGTKGWFIPWICGATCNDAKVVWDRDGYRYFVGFKVGDKAELIEMANSAINSAIGQVR